MSDPLDRLSAADPEHGRGVPPTPPFTPPGGAVSPWWGPLRAVAIAAAIVALVGIPMWLLGIGGEETIAPADTTTTTEATTTSTPDTTTTTTPDSTTSTSQPESSSTVDTTSDDVPEWAGEAFDFWVPTPVEGPVIGVIGVRHDDVLNLRSGPGVDFDVVAELGPTADGISATGAGWQLPSGEVWWEIRAEGVVGWANQRYLSRLGEVDDVTSLVVDRHGDIPEADSLEALGEIVVDAFAGFDWVEAGGWVEVVVAPTEGDLGEVTLDVVGVADDSIGGFRLHVFGQPLEQGGFALKAVEAMTFCMRGLDDGVCV